MIKAADYSSFKVVKRPFQCPFLGAIKTVHSSKKMHIINRVLYLLLWGPLFKFLTCMNVQMRTGHYFSFTFSALSFDLLVWAYTSFTSTKRLPFANWSVSDMSDVSLEWHLWASWCPMCGDGDGSTQTMAIFHHTWLQKLLASPSWHSLFVKMGFTQV